MIRNLTKNQITTLKHLYELGSFTQVEIARKLNISIPAANVQFKKLKQEGYIVETEELQLGDIGRPKRLWSINWDGNFVLSFIFVSGDLLMGLANFHGHVIDWKATPLSEYDDHKTILKAIDDFTEKAKRQAESKSGHIRSAYFGITGNEEGIVEKSVNMQAIEGLSIPAMESYFENKHHIFCHSCSHLYAFYFGESDYYDNETTIDVIEWDDGIGNVTGCGQDIFYIPINPKTQEGRGIRDIGHMIIEKNGKKCRCGKNGCLEAYVSGWSIKQQLGRIKKLDQLISLIQEGDTEALEALKAAARILGEQISWLVRYWGIDKIAFTGRMSILLPYFKQSFCDGLEKYLPTEKVAALNPAVNSDNPFERIIRGASRVSMLSFFHNEYFSHTNKYSDVIFNK